MIPFPNHFKDSRLKEIKLKFKKNVALKYNLTSGKLSFNVANEIDYIGYNILG
jgi:hypothetical protein